MVQLTKIVNDIKLDVNDMKCSRNELKYEITTNMNDHLSRNLLGANLNAKRGGSRKSMHSSKS
jgi:hypothetical protein